MADEINLEHRQQFAPVTNRSKSRSGIDNRYTKHKPRKQDHLTTMQANVRSVSDTDPYFEKYLQIPTLQKNVFELANFREWSSIDSRYTRNYCSNSSLGSSDSQPGSCGDSQPGSSDESTANQNSPRRWWNSNSPDSFGSFRENHSANTPDMLQNEKHQMNFEKKFIRKDLNMNFMINLMDVDDNFARQSHNLVRSPDKQVDASNNVSTTEKKIDSAEQQQSFVCEQTACISSGRWELTSTSITNEPDTEEHQNGNTSQSLPLQPGEAHFCPRLYCKTCSKRVCENSEDLCVYRHVTIEYKEFLDIVQQQVEDILAEGIDVLKDDMKDMDEENPSCFLYGKAKDQRTVYGEHFSYERFNNLRDDQGRLNDALQKLERSIDHRVYPPESINKLLIMKDRVVAEIWRVRQNRRSKIRPGRENGNFSRNYRSQSYFPHEATENFRPKYPIPRGRPITCYDHNIYLPNNTNQLDIQVQSTELKFVGYFSEGNCRNLCRPWGVTVDADGNIIVSDRSNNRIQIFQENVLIRCFGTYGNGECEFNKPAGIAVDARRRLIVADKDNHRIQILTMEGKFLRQFGEHGDKAGCFNYPWDVAVNSTCEIAVTDTRNRRVQLFSAEGVFLRMFDGQSQNLRYLDSPRGVCFNKEGNLLVTDFNNHHVLKIDYDMEQARILRCDNELRFLRGDGGKEMLQNVESAPFQRPQGIIAADDGNFLVADSRHNSIKAFNSLGHLMYVYSPGLEEINRPLGLALHTDGRLVFTDNGQNTVRLVKLTNHVKPIKRNTIMFG